jgi:diguanylate cyclase (GGDEF)-like protein/PAS domain S-box-containing protein
MCHADVKGGRRMSTTREWFERTLRDARRGESLKMLRGRAHRALEAARHALPAPMRTLRFRIALSCALTVGAVMAVASALQLASIHQEAERTLTLRQARETELLAALVSMRVRDRIALLRSLADEARPIDVATDPEPLKALAKERAVLSAAFDAIELVGPDGRVVARAERNERPSARAPAGLRRGADGGSDVVVTLDGVAGPQPRLSIAVRPTGPGGALGASLVGLVDVAGPRGLADVAHRFDGGGVVAGFLVDAHGRAAALPGAARADAGVAIAAMGAERAGVRMAGDAIISWTTVAGTDLRYLEIAPARAPLGWLAELRDEATSRVMAWTLVAGLAMFVLAARLLRRLERLRGRAARVLTDPDHALDDWPGGPDEIGDLSRVFRQVVITRIGAEQRAQRARADAQAIVEGAGVGVVVVQHGRIGSASPSATRLLGLPDHALDGRPIGALGLDPDARFALDGAWGVLERTGRFELDLRARRADGDVRMLRVIGSPLRAHAPGEGAVLVVEDVTALRAAQGQLELSRQILSRLHEAIVVTDAHDRVVSANPAFLAMTGRRWPEVAGRSAADVGLPVLPADAGTAAGRELPVIGVEGDPIDCWVSVASLRAARGDLHVRVLADIRDLKASERALHRLAMHDPLTGLPNRALLRGALDDAAARARDSGRPFALLYLDLDGFKAVNDTHGHEAGDLLLCEVAQRLLRTVRGGDSVFRLGGDEFVAIADDVPDLMTVGLLCERVLAALQAPVQVGAVTVTVGASIGACRYPVDEPTLDGMVRRADEAMLRAKRAGAGRWVPADREAAAAAARR